MTKSRTPRRTPPWGSLAALLAGGFATVAGLVRGIDPDVILWRSLVAATLVGALTAVASAVAHSMQSKSSQKPAHGTGG